MGYLALYRKFRPQRFADLIGQESVVKALINQIATERIGHAYLFCGARGTGKTTAAKIFAKAINCQSKSGEPCGNCDVCKSLNDVSNLDIVEMDAASNNKVENVREIREKVQYPPVNGAYKVYIIDEVHMLTSEAFNALLKTLEEPPKHAVFILATTEPHKLPATILSRCMRFDFKLIPTSKIAELIAEIFTKEGKAFEQSAVMEIARAGEGSVRDALSVADICLSFNNEKLTYKDVIEVLGASDRSKVLELTKAIFTNNTGDALKIVDELIGLGKGAGMLTRDLLNCFREIMVAKTCVNVKGILVLPDDELERIDKVAKLIDNHGILRIVEIFSAIENDLKFSTQPRIIFETAVVKATMPRNDYNIDALLSRVTKLEEMINSGAFSTQKQVVVEKVVEKIVEKPVEKIVEKVAKKQVVEKNDEPKIEQVKDEEIKAQVQEKPTNKTVNNDFDEFFNEPLPEPPIDNIDDLDEAFTKKDSKISSQNNEQTQQVETETKLEEKTQTKNVELSVDEAVSTVESNVITKQEQNFGELKSTVPDRRLWGTMLRKLRDNKQSVLWAVCQELDAKVENGVLYIIATEDNEYNAVTKPNNIEALKTLLASFCNYSLSVVKEQPKLDSFEQDVIKVSQDFEVKIVD